MIVDAFMFYNEFDILELRFELLDRCVDQFVLVEAEVNHVGGPKPLFFKENSERYARWAHKIRHVIVTKEGRRPIRVHGPVRSTNGTASRGASKLGTHLTAHLKTGSRTKRS